MKIPRDGKKETPCCSGVVFTAPGHPMATGLRSSQTRSWEYFVFVFINIYNQNKMYRTKPQGYGNT